MSKKDEVLRILNNALKYDNEITDWYIGEEEFDMVADNVVKLFAIPDVSKRSELLKLKEFVSRQKNLPSDINQIVNDNFWDLI